MPKNDDKRWRSGKGPHKVISWEAAGPESLKSVICAITNSGGAIMFSKTQDDGALILSIYSGDDRSKEYCSEAGDIPSLLAWAIETYG